FRTKLDMGEHRSENGAAPTPWGLGSEEAARRLAIHGPNVVYHARPRGGLTVLAAVLREPMFLLLLGAAALYLMLGDLGEGLFLTGGACVAVGLVFAQEVR